MTKRLDLKPGTRFGRLVLTGNRETRNGKIFDECRCDCGTTKFIGRSRLRNGTCTSCGCYQKEFAKNLMTKHGMRHSRIYKIYKGAKDRCIYPSNPSYKNYGAKGIKFEWDCFEDFYMDMGASYDEHVKQFGERETTIDRIDPNGNYCKDNCRWATYKEQQNNRNNSRVVTYKGVTYPSVKIMCEKLGLNYWRVKYRVEAGWDVKDAVELSKYGSYHNERLQLE